MGRLSSVKAGINVGMGLYDGSKNLLKDEDMGVSSSWTSGEVTR